MKRNLLRIAFIALSFGIVSSAAAQQQTGMSKYAAKRTPFQSERGSSGTPAPQSNSFFVPLPAAITIPGTDTIGIGSKYQLQTDHGGLHNIQVDPSNPQNIHAVVMEVPNVTAKDTTTASDYPNRNCYYVFSSNGGQTWTTPKAVAATRGGFPDMVLRKNSTGNYMPVIALHRNMDFPAQQEDFVVSLYMDAGSTPGAGDFVGMDANQTTSDGLSGVAIIWPSVAISPDGTKAYVVAAYDDPSSGSEVDDLQFGWFEISDAGPSSFNGWFLGPEDGEDDGYASDGEYSINVSDSGTVGVAWVSYNFADSERALYYAVTRHPELATTDPTSDTAWTDQVSLWEPQDSTSELQNVTDGYLVANGVDLVYQGEVPYIAFTAYDQDLRGDEYYPGTGTLGFWTPKLNQGTPDSGAPILLMSLHRANSYDNTGSFSDGSVLSDWTRYYVDADGISNVQYPTISHPAGSSEWNIYFQTWLNYDTTSDMIFTVTSTEGMNTIDTVSEPYSSICRMYTFDNGNTWTASTVLTNEPGSSGQQFDYRYPEVSTFLPTIQGHITYPILFAADTAAGVFENPGYPNWDIMDWYYESDTLGAPSAVEPQSPNISLALQQNYPNPSTGVSKINFTTPDESNVVLTVEDVLGRTIATLVNGPLGPGDHTFTFDAGDLPNGVYSYTLRADGESVTKSMSLIR